MSKFSYCCENPDIYDFQHGPKHKELKRCINCEMFVHPVTSVPQQKDITPEINPYLESVPDPVETTPRISAVDNAIDIAYQKGFEHGKQSVETTLTCYRKACQCTQSNLMRSEDTQTTTEERKAALEWFHEIVSKGSKYETMENFGFQRGLPKHYHTIKQLLQAKTVPVAVADELADECKLLVLYLQQRRKFVRASRLEAILSNYNKFKEQSDGQ